MGATVLRNLRRHGVKGPEAMRPTLRWELGDVLHPNLSVTQPMDAILPITTVGDRDEYACSSRPEKVFAHDDDHLVEVGEPVGVSDNSTIMAKNK